ncbi:hypothetical protein HQQ81_19750 [Microbacteriaceae bacterium VKM Ac-2854]|nr:hypothetical protein [Microbacteriaceae bacterium VKM Ac-2854]
MTRHRLPMLLAVAAVFTLAGCSGGAIDIPEGEAASAASTVVPTPAASPTDEQAASEPAASDQTGVPASGAPTSTAPAVDCATALPVATIADELDIPVAYVTITETGGAGSCAYTIAGNSGALQFGWTSTDQSVDELAVTWAQQYPTAETVVFADGGVAFTPAAGTDSAGQPLALLSVSGDIQLSAYSYLGDQDQLRTFARDLYEALGRTVG